MFALARPLATKAFSRGLAWKLPGVGIATIYTLPELPYAYNALEPYISEEIMKLHHQKHHQTYVNGLNAAKEKYEKSTDVKEQISLQAAIKFNGGGHINHSLFWKNLAPSGSTNQPKGALKEAIDRDFGSLDALKKSMNEKTAAIQGSGWGWLGYNKASGKLEIVTTPNQDPLLSNVPLLSVILQTLIRVLAHVPIIGIDIWEHAFYLQYKNVKPDYLNAIWNVINFEEAGQRYDAAKSK